MPYRVRLAVPDDMTAILDQIRWSAKWLKECKNTDQWASPWPDEPTRDDRVAQGIADGLTWIVEVHKGELVGTFTCRDQGSPKLWTARELREPAAYISRLIVDRAYAGRGVGAAMIEWAGAHGRDQWKAHWTRVDVWTTNSALHDYYKARGFEHLRTLNFDDPWEYPSAALFQKPIAPRRRPRANRNRLYMARARRPQSLCPEQRSAGPPQLGVASMLKTVRRYCNSALSPLLSGLSDRAATPSLPSKQSLRARIVQSRWCDAGHISDMPSSPARAADEWNTVATSKAGKA